MTTLNRGPETPTGFFYKIQDSRFKIGLLNFILKRIQVSVDWLSKNNKITRTQTHKHIHTNKHKHYAHMCDIT